MGYIYGFIGFTIGLLVGGVLATVIESYRQKMEWKDEGPV